MIDLTLMKNMVSKDKFIISNHARTRMFQRNITTDELIEVIVSSQIIESYPEDIPCPSALLLGMVLNEAVHVVAAQCTDHIRIVTVYFPAKDKWIENRIRIDEQ